MAALFCVDAHQWQHHYGRDAGMITAFWICGAGVFALAMMVLVFLVRSWRKTEEFAGLQVTSGRTISLGASFALVLGALSYLLLWGLR